MTKQVFYRYLGTNGVIESPIHLEDIYYVRVIRLMADKHMVLTNGKKTVSIISVPEDEVDLWTEVPAP
ncbi:MAG: hypothetical protein J6V44_07650 [Methanobrevibacter sp.]|nr:hypothetical protein [Methanobrevibacter sp.]